MFLFIFEEIARFIEFQIESLCEFLLVCNFKNTHLKKFQNLKLRRFRKHWHSNRGDDFDIS